MAGKHCIIPITALKYKSANLLHIICISLLRNLTEITSNLRPAIIVVWGYGLPVWLGNLVQAFLCSIWLRGVTGVVWLCCCMCGLLTENERPNLD